MMEVVGVFISQSKLRNKEQDKSVINGEKKDQACDISLRKHCGYKVSFFNHLDLHIKEQSKIGLFTLHIPKGSREGAPMFSNLLLQNRGLGIGHIEDG